MLDDRARVAAMVDRNEYKRRQAAPGLRVSGKAFGVGRRLPVVMNVTRVESPTLVPPVPEIQ